MRADSRIPDKLEIEKQEDSETETKEQDAEAKPNNNQNNHTDSQQHQRNPSAGSLSAPTPDNYNATPVNAGDTWQTNSSAVARNFGGALASSENDGTLTRTDLDSDNMGDFMSDVQLLLHLRQHLLLMAEHFHNR